MFSQWVRVGDYYQRAIGKSDLTNSVTYKNTSLTAIVIEIHVLRYFDGDRALTLIASPFESTKLESAILSAKFTGSECRKESSFGYGSNLSYKIYFIKDGLATFKKLNQVFSAINGKMSRPDISSALITEINQLISETKLKNINKKHLIEEEHVIQPHVNPAKKNSYVILDLLSNHKISDKELLEGIDRELTDGADPNQQRRGYGDTPIILALYDRPLRLVKLLVFRFLAHRADPFKRYGYISYHSALDVTRLYNQIEIFDFIIASMTRPEKPIMKVEKTEYKLLDGKIQLTFTYANDFSFVIDLKSLSDLTDDENKKLFEVFSVTFQNNLEKNYSRSFSPDKNKLIQLIYAKDKNKITLIGAILYEIIKPEGEEYKYRFTVHEEYGLMHELFRNNSQIFTIWLHYFAYSLDRYAQNQEQKQKQKQELEQDLLFSVYASNVGDDGYLLVGGLMDDEVILHSPKNQSPSENRYIEQIIQKTGAKTIRHHNMNWVVIEDDDEMPLEVVETKHGKKRFNIDREYFNKRLKGDAIGYVPTEFLVDKNSYNAFKKLAHKIGIDWSTLVCTVANLLRKVPLTWHIIPPPKEEIKVQEYSLPDHSLTFWGIKKPNLKSICAKSEMKTDTMNSKFHIRSKL